MGIWGGGTSVKERLKEGDMVYFYYSGHGVPDNSGESFILPKDNIPDYIEKEDRFKLSNIYKQRSDRVGGAQYDTKNGSTGTSD
ncbi:MAG: hypothetical protein HY753_05255 [Nitrospirae bacterium]|nr:hypothetical protein [Nitrospirota bacterium]